MRAAEKCAWHLALILGLITPAWAADDLMTARLIDEAHHWQEKNRSDLAAIAWRKVLLAVPGHAEALSQLGAIATRSERSTTRATRSAAVKPANAASRPDSVPTSAFQGSSSSMSATPQVSHQLAIPRATVIETRTPTRPPATKQPQTQPVVSTVDNWASTRRALEAAAQADPTSVAPVIVLARHLGTREASRREALRLMADFTQRGVNMLAVQNDWRSTLMALHSTSADQAFFDSYLDQYSNDEAVRLRSESLPAFDAASLIDCARSCAFLSRGVDESADATASAASDKIGGKVISNKTLSNQSTSSKTSSALDTVIDVRAAVPHSSTPGLELHLSTSIMQEPMSRPTDQR